MTEHRKRSFAIAPAERRPDPVLLGISGPSSSGKTKSALLLGAGLVSVTGGHLVGIDTEGGRMAKYAPALGQKARPPESFDFQHMLFEPPYNPLSYKDAIEAAEEIAGPGGCIIIDSQSHEHVGEGGRIDATEKEAQRRAQKWNTSVDKVMAGSYAINSLERGKLLWKLGRRKCHIILCFRAKESVELGGKEKVTDVGFTPIGCDAYIWELDSSILLMPRAAGLPTWRSDKKGEVLCLKLDDAHKGILDDGERLSMVHGAQLARANGWAAQTKSTPSRSSTPDATSEPEPGRSAPAVNKPSATFPADMVRLGERSFDPAAPETLPAQNDMSPTEWRAFGEALRRLITQAESDGLKHAWARANGEALLRLASVSPALRGWILEALPIFPSPAPHAGDRDAPLEEAGLEGRVATSSSGEF